MRIGRAPTHDKSREWGICPEPVNPPSVFPGQPGSGFRNRSRSRKSPVSTSSQPPQPTTTATKSRLRDLSSTVRLVRHVHPPPARPWCPVSSSPPGAWFVPRPCYEANQSSRYNSFCFILYENLKFYNTVRLKKHSSAMVSAPTSSRRPPCPRVDCRGEERSSHMHGWGKMRDDLRPDFARPRPCVDR